MKFKILALFVSLTLGATLALAQTTFTWTNNSSGFWSVTNKWSEGTIPSLGGSNDYAIIFNNLTGAVTATNDLGASDFLLNRLVFAGTNATLRGSNLVFVASSASVAPSLVVSNTRTYTIYNALVLSNDLTVSSTAAAGVTVSNNISGPGALILSNAAASTYSLLTLGTANTYDGGTRIYSGRLQLNTAAATLGTGDVAIASGAELYLSAAATISNNFFIAGNYAGDSLGALRLDSGATIRGVVNLTTNATIGTVSGTGNLQADVRGDYTVTKVGGGTLVLTGSNTYSGGTTVTAGSIQFDTLNSVPTSGQIFINTNGVLNATGAYTPDAWLTSNRLDPNSAGIFVLTAYNSAALNFSNYPGLWLGASGTVTNAGPITAGGGTYRLGGSGTLVITGDLALTGANALLLATNGTVTITGANNFSGGTTIPAAGANLITIYNSDALGTGPINILRTGDGGLALAGGLTITNAMNIALTDSGNGGNLRLLSGATTLAGPITALGTGGLNGPRINAANGATLTISGVISGGTNQFILFNHSGYGTGTVVLAANNTYLAPTLVYAGITRIAVDNALPTNSFVYLRAGTLDLNSRTQIVAGLSTWSASGVSPVITNTGASTATLIINGSIGSNYTHRIGGDIALVMQGGYQILSGTNTYTGGTTLLGGVLQFNNTVAIAPGTTNLVVPFGATLAAGYAMDTNFINIVSGVSSGTLALAASTSNPLDFNTPGLTNVSLGAVTGTFTNSGALTPFGTTYRLGGGGGTLVVSTVLTDVNATATTLNAFGSGSGGTLVIATNQTFTGDTTVNAGTLQFNTGGSLASTNVTIAGGAFLAFNRSDTVTNVLGLSGAGSLVQKAGTFVITNANSYTGDTIVNTGTLSLATGGSVSSTNITVASGARLVFDRTDVFTNTTFVTGSGSLIKQGTGTLVLAATNNFAGQLLVQAGTVELPATATYASANATPIIVGGTTATSTLHITGGEINLLNANPVFNVGEINQNQFIGAVVQDDGVVTSGGSLRLGLLTNIASGVYTLNNGFLNLTNTGNSYLQIGRDGFGQFNQNGGTVTVARTQSGWANPAIVLAQSTNSVGTYTMTGGLLNATNSVANSATVIGYYGTGTLTINGAGAIANLAGPLVLGANGSSTGTVNFTAGELRIGMVTRGAGTGTFNWNGGILRPFNANAVVSNSLPLTLTGAGTSFNTLDAFGTARTITVLSAIGENGGSFGITKNGDGTLVLGTNNTYTGVTTLNGGTLQLGNGSTVGSIPDTSLNLPATTWLAFNRSDVVTNWIALTGSGGLVQKGSSTLVLTNVNNYDGLTVVAAGAMFVANNNALGTTVGGTVVSNNARLVLGDGVNIIGETIAIAGSGNFGSYVDYAGALQAGTNATATWSGPILLNAAARIGTDSNATLIINGVIQDGAANNVEIGAGPGTVAAALGTVIFNATNTYSGATRIIRGTLKLGATDVLPTNTSLDVAYTTSAEKCIVDLNGNNQTIGALQRTGSSAGIVTNSSASAVSTLTINPFTNTTYSGSIIGNINLVINGVGTQSLSGANSYTGPTTINNGVLQLSGTGTLPATVITNNGVFLFNRTSGYVLPTTTITGSGIVVNASNNPLTLSYSNSYSGGTWITGGGRIAVADNNALGTGPLYLTGNGATLSASNGLRTLANNIFITTNVQLGSSVDSGALALNGAVDLGGATRTLTIANNSGSVTINGSVTNGGLTKAGGTLLVLNGLNTFTGDVTINTGVVEIANSQALGIGPKTVNIFNANNAPVLRLDGTGGDITLASNISFRTSNSSLGAIINKAGNNTIQGNFSITGGNDTFLVVSNGTLTLTGTLALEAGQTTRSVKLGGPGNGFITGILSGQADTISTNLGVLKVDAGVWTLTGTNTYLGLMQIQGGILVADNGVGISGASSNININGGTWSAPAGLITNSLGNGNGQIQILAGASGFSAYNNPLTVNLNNNTGMLAWASATFNPAAFVLNAAAANNNLTLLNAIDLYGGTRTVSVNAATATISGVITDTVGNAALTMTGAGTLIASNSVNYTGLTTVNSGTLVFSAGYNNGTPNGLTKSGSGTLLLTAPVTYTGTTTVKQGTVQLGANGVLPNTAALVLGDTTALANAGTLDLNGNSFTVPSLSVVTLASNNSTATNAIINLLPGQTLNIVNASAGSVVDIAEGTHLVISGGGAFDVNAPSGDFHIRGYRSGNGTNFSGLNVSQLASFAAVVNNFYVCDDIGLANASRQGILSLAATNTITANSFYAGYSTQAGTAPGIVLLGVSNTFNVANLYLGYGKANGTLTFNSTVTGGQLTLTGTNGTRANLYLGYFAPGGLSGTTPTGTLTITNTGASVSAMLDQLIIGYEAQNNGSTTASGGFGSLTFNAGTIDANTLVLGQNIATVTRGAAAGTLTINGGVLNVHSNFTLANRPGNTGTATVNGTLLISGGLVNAFTNITDGGGTSTLTLNGGTLDMQTHNIGDGVNPINNLTLQSGALMNVAEINGGSNITVAAAANTLTLLSTNSWSGNTILNAGTLTISGLLPNSRVIANSGVLAGNGNVGQTVIVSNNATLSPGNYTGHIATFTAGNLTITNNAVLALDLGAPTTAGVTYDTVTVTNQLNFAAINTNYFVFTALGGFGVAGEYTLLQFANAGSVSMDPTGGTNYINILGSGRDAALWYDTVGNNIKLTVIPEPDALLLVAGGIGLLVLMRRRARR